MRDFFDFIFECILPLIAVVIIIIAIALPMIWFISREQVKVVNAEFGTNYTTRQYMFAGAEIKYFVIGGKYKIEEEK